jgi:hypothetical protein
MISASFLFKLVFAPVMLAATSLIGRRWGPAVGGSLAALPVITGTITFLVALEQGPAFTSHLAAATLIGIGSLAWFSLGYAQLSRRSGWPLCLAGAYAIVLVASVAIVLLENAPGIVDLAYVLVALAVAARMLPAPQPGLRQEPPAWDIPARMITAALIVVSVTTIAQTAGPQLSGLLAALPMNSTVLIVFTHRHEGAERTRGILRGFVTGLAATAVFLEIVADGVGPLGVAPVFVLAALTALAYQAIAIWWIRRSAAVSGEPSPSY